MKKLCQQRLQSRTGSSRPATIPRLQQPRRISQPAPFYILSTQLVHQTRDYRCSGVFYRFFKFPPSTVILQFFLRRSLTTVQIRIPHSASAIIRSKKNPVSTGSSPFVRLIFEKILPLSRPC